MSNNNKYLNNDIKEAYCSFEVSKLLKEKGFDCECNTHYSYGSGDKDKGLNPNHLVYIGGFINDDNGCNRPYRNSELCEWELPFGEFTRPSHALAIEWIRVNFGIYKDIRQNSISKGNYFLYIKQCIKPFHTLYASNKYYSTPQEATEAALLYVLKELI